LHTPRSTEGANDMTTTTFPLERQRAKRLDLPTLGNPKAVESSRSFAFGIATQFALVFAAALAYFGVRGLTEGSEATAVDHAQSLLGMERWLNVDIEAGLQSLVIDHRWIVTLANWVYIWGHWPVITATFIWLYRKHRPDYFLLRNAMFISGAIGLVIFALLPVAPPRLLPSGYVDTVTNLSTSYRVLQPPQLINEFAAVPSLHVGWNLLVGLMIFRAAKRSKFRYLGFASPVFMATAVVLTANHYVTDVLVGMIVALAGLAIAFASQRIANCMKGHHTETDEASSGSCLNSFVWLRPGSARVDELVPAA